MTAFSHRPHLRWVVPLVAALVLATAGSVIGVVSAVARSGLPHRSAAQLLVDVQRARLDGLSGTVVQNADLGLPSLPDGGQHTSSSDLASLVSGSHTLRVWYAGPTRVRLALLGSLGESDVVRNGHDLWTWSSQSRSATHRTVPTHDRGPRSLADASPLTPQQAARAALASITPTTRVTTDGTAVVAGRSAYELVLAPRGSGSTIGAVRIAIDGTTHLPLRVQVFARGTTTPAFQVGFVSFDPATPAPSVFRFNPPPGTKVTKAGGGFGALPSMPSGRGSSAPDVVGKGWSSVVVTDVPPAVQRGSGVLSSTLASLPEVHGAWGSGHLLRGTLFSAVLTDDGRLAVGPVPPATLYAALGAG